MKPQSNFRSPDDQLLINVKDTTDKQGNPKTNELLYIFKKDVECQVALIGGTVKWDADSKDGITYLLGDKFTAKNTGKVYRRVNGWTMKDRESAK